MTAATTAASLDEAARVLGTDAERLFEWLRSNRYAYRHTGIGSGRKLAYRRWVRQGLFANTPDLSITPTGMLFLVRNFERPPP
ncbi:MAG: phage antirepressor KilAC domain-containing protein [Geminicoccaceae bacterium]